MVSHNKLIQVASTKAPLHTTAQISKGKLCVLATGCVFPLSALCIRYNLTTGNFFSFFFSMYERMCVCVFMCSLVKVMLYFHDSIP